MCGIFGRLGSGNPLTDFQIKEAHIRLQHRGPDDRGLETGSGFDLGFNRLAILDLSDTGHQPMWDPGQRYCLVFNGEIFNYRELRQQYLQDIDLRGSSDTEVLLHLLITKGSEAINLLNGMFAFCWLDTETGEFILARDRFGIKPLYYSNWEGQLYFASELKALRSICSRPYQASESAVFDYLGQGYVSGEQSIYEEVYKFPPAHWAKGNINRPDQLQRDSYWQLDITEDYSGSYETALDELDELLSDAVRLRLRSDVPLGIFLSGGIDSGLVAAMAARVREIDCYTISFPGASQDESGLAKATARHIGARWHSIELKDLDSVDLDQLAWFYDEPFADSSAIPSYAICLEASKKATVFLTGDAGDEAFAGYKRYIKSLKHHRLLEALGPMSHAPGFKALTPLKHRSKLDRIQAPKLFRDAYPDNLPNTWYYRKLMTPDTFARFQAFHLEKAAGFYRYKNITSNQQHFDYQYYLPDDILVKMDRASMANSIEVRSPFLDYRIHEWAARLPRHWLIDHQHVGKKILRDLAARYLPQNVIDSKKKGFGIPIHDWTRQKEFLDNTFHGVSDFEERNEYFVFKDLHKLLSMHESGRINIGSMVWKLNRLAEWEKHWLYHKK